MLFEFFNRRHIGIPHIIDLEYEKKMQNMSVLTVGARALSKHAHRSTEVCALTYQGYWGEVSGSEGFRNEKAN